MPQSRLTIASCMICMHCLILVAPQIPFEYNGLMRTDCVAPAPPPPLPTAMSSTLPPQALGLAPLDKGPTVCPVSAFSSGSPAPSSSMMECQEALLPEPRLAPR